MKDRLRSLLWGFFGTLACVVVLLVFWLMYITLMRARNGEMAWECLHTPNLPVCAGSIVQPKPEKP